MTRPRMCVLVIRDGWGANPYPEWNHANAVYLARTPVDDALMAAYPHVQIRTCGPDVGLPDGVMGNSEVGHQNLGAGRIVDQAIQRISRSIRDGSFFENGALRRAFDTPGCVHVMGLCSNAGVHSSLEHLYALMELTRRLKFPSDRLFVHAFGDGRDSPPNSGIEYIRQVEENFQRIGAGRIASVIGRYYAMDRDNRWDRVEKAYRMLTAGTGYKVRSAGEALRHYYEHATDATRHGDEFVEPAVVTTDGRTPLATIRNGDSVIFFNFRGDRPRQLIKALTLDEFPFVDQGQQRGFARPAKLDLYVVTMTTYEQGLPVAVAFPDPGKMKDIFGAYLCGLGLRQFRCAETEKYPHVTFFFNDYREEPFDGEDRQIIPSPRDVPTYDLKPEMSAYGVADETVRRIESGQYDGVIVNFANGDMVGHTGSLTAAIKAVETVDECVGRIVEAVRRAGGSLIVTADHGNCEQMIDPDTGGPHTAHTTYDVELIVVDDRHVGRSLRTGGRLADVVPTMLELMGMKQPEAMTGRSLLLQ